MKKCPACIKYVDDESALLCQYCGTTLLDTQINPNALAATVKIKNVKDVTAKERQVDACPEWGLFLGLGLCLLSGVSLVMLNEPNTKKLFKANAAHGYNTALVLMLAIFIVGAYMSFLNARKAVSDGNEKRVDREFS